MPRIQRRLRLYDFEIRIEEPDGRWQLLNFTEIAARLRSEFSSNTPAVEPYLAKDDERWYLRFDRTGMNPTLRIEEVMGVSVRSRIRGIPQLERNRNLEAIPREGPETGIAETSVFGVYDNRILVFQTSRDGLRAGDLSTYLEEKLNGFLLNTEGMNEAAIVIVDIRPITSEKFREILPQVEKLTNLHMRPRWDARDRLAAESNLPLFKALSSISGDDDHIRRTELDVTTGRGRAHPRYAFGEDIVSFFKEYFRDERNMDDFDILEMTALLRSGEITKLDISGEMRIQKKGYLRESADGILDVEDAYDKVQTVYAEKIEEGIINGNTD